MRFESRVFIELDSGYPKDTGVISCTLSTPGNPLRYNTHRSAPPVSALAHSMGPRKRSRVCFEFVLSRLMQLVHDEAPQKHSLTLGTPFGITPFGITRYSGQRCARVTRCRCCIQVYFEAISLLLHFLQLDARCGHEGGHVHLLFISNGPSIDIYRHILTCVDMSSIVT